MNPAIPASIEQTAIRPLQYATIFICFLMNVLDGMDVLVISYCAPAIAKSWNVGPEALGVVFSSGLVGMTLGALLLAPAADHVGRKTMILVSTVLMGGSIFLTSFVTSVAMLLVMRLISGFGIGCMLASTAALTAEYTPDRSRDFWVSLAIAGYPMGAILSGMVAASVVPHDGWPRMFQLAGLASFVTLPVAWYYLSESLAFYLRKQPAGALDKANTILEKLGRERLAALPANTPQAHNLPFQDVLGSEYRLPTFQLWTALFLSFASLYFLTAWIPKLASNAGLSLSLAIYAGTVFNGGAFVGVLTQGYCSSRFGLKKTIGTFLIITAVLMASFRFFIGSNLLLPLFGLLGFGIQGGFVGLYAISARLYPTEFKAAGVGWAIGVGRLGGIIGPALGGVLIGMGLSLADNFLAFAVPTLLAGIATLYIATKKIS
ncbi:MFS transporter [Spirosoma rhododendri]|uniref:MFS transporter n=1 Tax=Spirosoma rhododendri TaxID=2728024 RepID=A0A7L5DTR3_9BACT|nr:MFS transporter [Spirosoma rhododendri]QJD79988.1 MFS transporter [Spirosoma rhododendri]